MSDLSKSSILKGGETAESVKNRMIEMTKHNFHEKHKAYLKEKQWAPISSKVSFADALARLTKVELDTIRRFIKLKGVSKLAKPQLIEVLVENHTLIFEKAMAYLDKERFDFLKQAALQGPQEFIPTDAFSLNWFKKTGLLIPGSINKKFVVVMPEEFKPLLLDTERDQLFKQVVIENEDVIFATRGLIETFGVLRWTDLFTKLESLRLTTKRLEFDEIVLLLQEYNDYEYYFEMTKEWVADLLLDHPEDMLQAIERRTEIEPVPVKREEMIELGRLGELPKNREFEKFEKYLNKTFRVDRETSEELIAQMIPDIRNELSFHEVMQVIVQNFEFSSKAQAAEFTSYVTKLVNSIPRWLLKGHAPNDISTTPVEVSTPSVKVVGRNEPCPCGSGKKYKKCCGK